MFLEKKKLEELKKGSSVEDILSYLADGQTMFVKHFAEVVDKMTTELHGIANSIEGSDKPIILERLTKVMEGLAEVKEQTVEFKGVGDEVYKEAVKEIGKISTIIEGFSKSNSIDKQLKELKDEVTKKNNSGWEFNVVRDAQNRINKITTKKTKI